MTQVGNPSFLVRKVAQLIYSQFLYHQKKKINVLVHERRASSISTLGNSIQSIFMKMKQKEDNKGAEILPNIFLGSVGAALNKEWLDEQKITHILCVASDLIDKTKKNLPNIIFKEIPILDTPTAEISTYFNQCYTFIQNCLESKGRILIHCFAGVSRSVTVMASYLLRKNKWSTIHAIKYIKERRKQANPNPGFLIQLIKFEKLMLKGSQIKQKRLSANSGISLEFSESKSATETEMTPEPPKQNGFESLSLEKYPSTGFINKNKRRKKKVELSVDDVEQWEQGRRPSLFEALNKFKLLKNQVQKNRQKSIESDQKSKTYDKSKNFLDSSTENSPNVSPNLSPSGSKSFTKSYSKNSPKNSSKRSPSAESIEVFTPKMRIKQFKSKITKLSIDIDDADKNSEYTTEDSEIVTPSCNLFDKEHITNANF